MPQSDYDRGFNEGLTWVAATLRLAATKVEFAERGNFTSANGGAVNAIARSGQPHFAAQLRAVAYEIERALREAPHGTEARTTPSPR